MAAQTRAKRKFGVHLAALRSSATQSLAAAGKELHISAVTLGRYESGEILPLWPTVLSIMNLFGASQDDQSTAFRLWEAANEEPPPIRLPTGTTKDFRRLVNAEREADAERVLSTSTVPGLLQTEAYARALMSAGKQLHHAGRMDAVVATRLSRQKRLAGLEPLKVHALMDESVLARTVGGREVMAAQLEHLLTLAPKITVQVIPFDAGAYGLMAGDCMIITYPEPDETPGVYLDYLTGGAWVDDGDDVSRFTTMFEDALAMALSPADTADMIRRYMGAVTDQ